MIFTVPGFASRTPVVSLGGRRVRYKAIIPIRVAGPVTEEICQILVDTGADDVVFPVDLASRLGVNLSSAPQRQAGGVGHRQAVSIAFAPVILQLEEGSEVFRWRAMVGFTAAPLRLPLLGIAGALEHFRTTLDVQARELLLIAHPSLPVTSDPVP
jgi:predicted aspartyl protease